MNTDTPNGTLPHCGHAGEASLASVVPHLTGNPARGRHLGIHSSSQGTTQTRRKHHVVRGWLMQSARGLARGEEQVLEPLLLLLLHQLERIPM